MSQTFLAVGALALVALLSLNAWQGRVSDDRRAVADETNVQTNRVAVDALNALRALPYDSGTLEAPAMTPAALHAHAPLRASAPNRFTLLAARATAAAAATPGSLARVDGRVEEVARQASHGATRYQIATVVGYVRPDGQTPSATPTHLKMATVRVQPVSHEGPPFYVSQLYACGDACDW